MPRRRRKVNFLATSLSKSSNMHLRNLLKKAFILKVGVMILSTNYLGKSLSGSQFLHLHDEWIGQDALLSVLPFSVFYIWIHYTRAASASTETGRKDCPFYTCLTLFLFYKCSLCFNCPKTSTPRCPVLIRFLFSLQLLHRFSSSFSPIPDQSAWTEACPPFTSQIRFAWY